MSGESAENTMRRWSMPWDCKHVIEWPRQDARSRLRVPQQDRSRSITPDSVWKTSTMTSQDGLQEAIQLLSCKPGSKGSTDVALDRWIKKILHFFGAKLSEREKERERLFHARMNFHQALRLIFNFESIPHVRSIPPDSFTQLSAGFIQHLYVAQESDRPINSQLTLVSISRG